MATRSAEGLASATFVRYVARSRQAHLTVEAHKITTLEHLHCVVQYGNAPPQVVHFEFACLELDELPASIRGMLGSAAALLKRHQCLRIQVDGHSQQGAPEPLATALSRERSELLSRALVHMYCVSPDRIDAAWHSNRRPNQNPDDLQRRVELTVSVDQSVLQRVSDSVPDESDAEPELGAASTWRDKPPSVDMINACLQFAEEYDTLDTEDLLHTAAVYGLSPLQSPHSSVKQVVAGLDTTLHTLDSATASEDSSKEEPAGLGPLFGVHENDGDRLTTVEETSELDSVDLTTSVTPVETTLKANYDSPSSELHSTSWSFSHIAIAVAVVVGGIAICVRMKK